MAYEAGPGGKGANGGGGGVEGCQVLKTESIIVINTAAHEGPLWRRDWIIWGDPKG